MRIAYLEDAEQDGATVAGWLQDAGYDVQWFRSAESMIAALRHQSFDLMLFDWMLSDMDGEQMLVWVRTNLDTRVPVIFLTNVAGEEQIAAILRLGADDYVVKPPRRNELLARIEAVLRRVTPERIAGRPIEIGPIRISPELKRIERHGTAVQLTAKEYELAAFLFANLGRLLPRDHLLKLIWGLNDSVATRTLDTHVSKVRNKLGLTPENGFRIASVQNYGYRLERYVPDA